MTALQMHTLAKDLIGRALTAIGFAFTVGAVMSIIFQSLPWGVMFGGLTLLLAGLLLTVVLP